jgi:peroxiredoxin Q/BCP
MISKQLFSTLAMLGLAFFSRSAAGDAEPQKELRPGDPAPPFEMQGSDGKTWRLADLKGTTVVLAWFPKAFTGG